ncbi:MAG: hypothetical protein IKD14_03470 [Clostridia bacterium]|nr:hypothetical protein [Clostridia bacterium]
MVKRICAVIIAACLAVSVAPQSAPVFSGGDGIYTVCVGDGSSGCFYTFPTEEIYKFYHFKKVEGQSLFTRDQGFVREFISDFGCVCVYEEWAQGIEIKYYYTPKISAYRLINGQKVNLQTAKTVSGCTIGTPVIFGGF